MHHVIMKFYKELLSKFTCGFLSGIKKENYGVKTLSKASVLNVIQIFLNMTGLEYDSS